MAMRPKKSAMDLPPRMLRRIRPRANGSVYVMYFYNGRDENGNRKEIPLGTDLDEAKRKWAELERKSPPAETKTMRPVFDRFEHEILPSFAHGTQRVYKGYLKFLRRGFETAPPDSITPQIIAQYRDARANKSGDKKHAVQANREVTLLSTIFNYAREWGHTSRENPCKGIRKFKEKPRDFYADDEVWHAVYSQGDCILHDAMDLMYYAAQRRGDVLKMKKTEIKDRVLEVTQNKTGKKLRIMLDIIVNGKLVLSKLGEVINRINSRPRKIQSIYILSNENGQPITENMVMGRFEKARSHAAEKAASEGKDELAGRIRFFQFRDIRAKAASDMESLKDASDLLGHTEQQITKTVYRRKGKPVNPVG